MKIKIILTLLILGCFSAFAQDNPYEIYGHKSNVIFETRVSEFLYIKNNDTLSETKAIAFNIEDGIVLFLGSNDTVLKILKIDPDKLLRWLSVDAHANKYPYSSPYNFCTNNPIIFIDPDGRDIVYFNKAGEEVHRIKSNTEFRTFIQSSESYQHPMISIVGWKEVGMPKIIQEREGNPKTNTKVPRYQADDYLIAAYTGLFNQAKNKGEIQLYDASGNPIPKGEAQKIPDADPTVIKAMVIEESCDGVKSNDIMQINNSGDWEKTKKQKSAFGLKKYSFINEGLSLYYGTMYLAAKGINTDVTYDNKAGKTNKTYKFLGWQSAVENYNGGGNPDYMKDINTMINNATNPTPSNYVNK